MDKETQDTIIQTRIHSRFVLITAANNDRRQNRGFLTHLRPEPLSVRNIVTTDRIKPILTIPKVI